MFPGDSSTFQPGTALPTSEIEISISCRDLMNKDILSKSDPMVVMYIQEFGKTNWYEVGRTEVIDNNLNPDFVKKMLVTYYFEEKQICRFDVYDIDSNSRNLSHHDTLGSMECSIGDILASPNCSLTRNIRGQGINRGRLTATAEEVSSCKDKISLHFRAHHLDKKDWFGKSDPYLEFQKCNEDNSCTVVYRTEVIKKNLNPTWRAFELPVRQLCNGDLDRTLNVYCYDWNSSGKSDLIGSFQTNVRTLMLGPGPENVYECRTKDKKGRPKNAGTVELMGSHVRQVHSFVDYLKGGMQMSFVVAIDFTASNGDPRSPNSLHYIDNHRSNQYSMALQAVGDIIDQYDTDKMYPVYGFGARIPPHGTVDHCFSVNLDRPNDAEVPGIPGILSIYESCIRRVQLYGPTNFAPVINKAIDQAREIHTPGENYVVLLIITDGVISDMNNTMKAIVNGAQYPISIIIVGVGGADFEAMDVLDGDDVRVQYAGKVAERDIVQFVPMRNFLQTGSVDPVLTQARLAKEVLAEIPEQVIQYMSKHGVKPGQGRIYPTTPANNSTAPTAPYIPPNQPYQAPYTAGQQPAFSPQQQQMPYGNQSPFVAGNQTPYNPGPQPQFAPGQSGVYGQQVPFSPAQQPPVYGSAAAYPGQPQPNQYAPHQQNLSQVPPPHYQ